MILEKSNGVGDSLKKIEDNKYLPNKEKAQISVSFEEE